MSPYRVLATGEYFENLVLCAGLSKQDASGMYNVYIFKKHIDRDIDNDVNSLKELAHKQCTQKNSDILADYQIWKDGFSNRYVVYRDSQKIGRPCMLLSECLVLAMNDFTAYRRYKVVTDL